MTIPIFCPSAHLMLSASRCPTCGWVRPTAGETGQSVWGPLDLGAALGGPGRSVFALPGVAQGVAVFPQRDGILAGISLGDGSRIWKTPLSEGLMARALAADVRRLLVSLSDERSLELAGPGYLAALDPLNGEVNPVWQPDAHQISSPTLAGELILLRTSTSELVALDRREGNVVWRRPLQAWWALPPMVVDETQDPIVLVPDGRPMHGEGRLLAFSLQSGKLLWQHPTMGLLAHPPVLAGGVLVIRDGHKSIAGLDPKTGDELWAMDYARIYSDLYERNGWVYLVVRGEAGAGIEGHYLLQALDPQKNTITWEMPLKSRTRLGRFLDDCTFLTGDDEGWLRACDLEQMSTIWEFQLGSSEDPIHTGLVLCNGLLLAGTYSGRVVALQAGPSVEDLTNPAELLGAGDYRGAADSFALQGNYRRAAEIYADELQEPQKALLLFEHDHLWAEAGTLAQKLGQNSLALQYFDKTEDLLAQADTLLKMGDEIEAAHRLEQAGELRKAAELYEKSGDLGKALRLYQALKDLPAYLRIWSKVRLTTADIEFLEGQGRLVEAGEAAIRVGVLERAAKLFERAGENQREFEVLVQFTSQKPEEWALERLAAVARSLGQFGQEAQAWEKLSRPTKAAEAFHRAARQTEQVTPDQENLIADLFGKAADYYAEAGQEPEELRCRSQVVYYRHLPQIIVEGKTTKAFREGEFNTLELVIHNLGRGIATDISVQVGVGRFEIDESMRVVTVNRLAPGLDKHIKIYLRPKMDQVGEAVPLLLEWSWRDRLGTDYQGYSSTPVAVKRINDTSPTGAPVVIHAQTFVQGTMIGGDQIGGDRIEGDQIREGAQKGDRVEIRRGEGVSLRAEGTGANISKEDREESQTILCPNCHLPIEPDSKFCPECRYELNHKD